MGLLIFFNNASTKPSKETKVKFTRLILVLFGFFTFSVLATTHSKGISKDLPQKLKRLKQIKWD
jgi:hypothetical protein